MDGHGFGEDTMSQEVNTQNGLFANQGHGGGLFNGNVAFGSADSPNQVPLGALPVMTKIPDHCEDSIPFKNEERFIRQGEAKLKCEYCATPEGRADEFTCGGYTTHWDCMERVVNDYLWNWSGAVNTFCPKDMSNIPRPVTADDACDSDIAIRNVQHMVGAFVDGNWGPDSQDAYDIREEQNGNTWCDYIPNCQGRDIWGNDCRGAAPAPTTTHVPPTPEEPEIELPEPKRQDASVLVIGGVIALLGATVYAISKK